MFLALLIIAAVLLIIAVIQKNWIYAAIAIGCLIVALLLGQYLNKGDGKAQHQPGLHQYAIRHAFKPVQPGAFVAILHRKL